jgi:hypothetical protein
MKYSKRLKSFLMCLVLFSILNSFCDNINAQNLEASGNVTSEAPNGKSYKTEIYGVDMNGAKYLDQVLMKGKGTYYSGNNKLLIYSGEIISIANNNITINVLGVPQEFRISTNTKYCDGKKTVSIEIFKKKMMVTITTGAGDNWVQTLRKGPMLWKRSNGERLVLNKYSCD